MDIGRKLKEARLAAGLTQEQAANAAQVSRQTMSSWENGRSVPDVVSVVRLAEVYGISLDTLVQDRAKAREQVSFLEKHWDTLYSAAVATLPLAALAEHFLSRGAALAVLILGAAVFALPRVLFARVFGGGIRNVSLGLVGWTLVLGRYLWRIWGGSWNFAGYTVMLTGEALVLFARWREFGGRDRKLKWHHWVVVALILAAQPLIWFSGALEGGDFNEANPFAHLYRIEAVEFGVEPGALLVELSDYENELRLLDPAADEARVMGSFVYVEPAAGQQEETVAGIWQLVPEDRAEELYRLTVEQDGEIRLSFLNNEELQWRYRLARADTLRWSTRSGGSVSGGPLEWYPEGSFDWKLENLNGCTIYGSGTVSILSEEPAEQITVYEIREDGARTLALNVNEAGGFALEVSGEPGTDAVYRIPWADGDYWFRIRFE